MCGAVAACWLGATARRTRTGRGLFLGMFRSSTESPYKAPHLGGWWKVGYQRRRSFFSTGPTRLHLVNTSPPPHILTPRASWSCPRASSAVASRCRSSLSHLDFSLVTLSCATLPCPAPMHSVLLPSPHLLYIINEGSEHLIASHRQGLRATPRWEITPSMCIILEWALIHHVTF